PDATADAGSGAGFIFVIGIGWLADVKYEIRREVDLDTGIEFHERCIAVMDDAGTFRLGIGIPQVRLFQGMERHGVSRAVVHVAEDNRAVARKADMPESKFIRCHFPASIWRWPRSLCALCRLGPVIHVPD